MLMLIKFNSIKTSTYLGYPTKRCLQNFNFTKKNCQKTSQKNKISCPMCHWKMLAGYFRSHEFRFYYKPVPPSTNGTIDDLRLIKGKLECFYPEMVVTPKIESMFLSHSDCWKGGHGHKLRDFCSKRKVDINHIRGMHPLNSNVPGSS